MVVYAVVVYLPDTANNFNVASQLRMVRGPLADGTSTTPILQK